MQVHLPALHMSPSVKRILIGAGVLLIVAAIVLLVVTWMHRSSGGETA